MSTAVLGEVFGHAGFRQGQESAVLGVLQNQDVLTVMPTGGGKSLCFQVPAIVKYRAGLGTALVISPLIALMDDQVRALRGAGVEAESLHSHRDIDEQRKVFAQLKSGNIAILYVSPERAASAGFQRLLAQIKVSMFAIDEAHCISQWGHDFRPEYYRISELRTVQAAPMIALTATATPSVSAEIHTRLKLKKPVVIRGTFRRENLRFSVNHIRSESDRLSKVLECIARGGFRGTQSSGRAIVYCATRKKVELVAKELKSQGYPVGYYHAGRTELARKRAQAAFETGRTRILVATNAFGMGIDCPDVRLLVHYQCPGSVEAYYQEAGRAGRDGAESSCVLFFGKADLVLQSRLSERSGSESKRGDSLSQMEDYARGLSCRQSFIESYFSDTTSDYICGCCDSCEGQLSESDEELSADSVVPEEPLLPQHEDEIVSAVEHMDHPVGKSTLAKALRGSRAVHIKKNKLLSIPEHGKLRRYTEASIVAAIENLLEEGRLVRRGQKYPTVWLPGRAIRPRSPAATDPSFTKKRKSSRSKSGYGEIFRELDNYRKRTARKLKWKPYMVFQKRVMTALDRQQPTTLASLERIPGLGPVKIERFGSDLLQIIAKHSTG